MVTKEQVKTLIDQLPEEKLNIIEVILQQLLITKQNILPKSNLGIKEPFNRTELYDEILANRL